MPQKTYRTSLTDNLEHDATTVYLVSDRGHDVSDAPIADLVQDHGAIKSWTSETHDDIAYALLSEHIDNYIGFPDDEPREHSWEDLFAFSGRTAGGNSSSDDLEDAFWARHDANDEPGTLERDTDVDGLISGRDCIDVGSLSCEWGTINITAYDERLV